MFSGGEGAGWVAAEEEFERAGGIFAFEGLGFEGAFGGGDVGAAELDIERAFAGALVVALDDAEVGFEGGEGFFGEGDLLFDGDEVAPCFGGVGGEGEACAAEVLDGGGFLGIGGAGEIAEAAPKVDFPGGGEAECVCLAA